MNIRTPVAALGILVSVLVTQQSTTRAEDVLEVEVSERESQGETKGPRCTFTRAEKFGMLMWLFPPAGAVYTPFACKRDVFDKKIDVEAR